MKFTGQVRFPDVDHPGIPVIFNVEERQAELVLDGESLGSWSLFDVEARRLISAAFEVSFRDEEITFIADSPMDFAYRGIEHMAEVWAGFKSKGFVPRFFSVRRSRRGLQPSKLAELRHAMIENLGNEASRASQGRRARHSVTQPEPSAPPPPAPRETAPAPQPAAPPQEMPKWEPAPSAAAQPTPTVDRSDDIDAARAALEAERARIEQDRRQLETERAAAEREVAESIAEVRAEIERLEAQRSEMRALHVAAEPDGAEPGEPLQPVLETPSEPVVEPAPTPVAPEPPQQALVVDLDTLDAELEPALAGAGQKSGLMGAVKAAFSKNSGRQHVHDFAEAPAGIGIVRSICRECGYVSISTSD